MAKVMEFSQLQCEKNDLQIFISFFITFSLKRLGLYCATKCDD